MEKKYKIIKIDKYYVATSSGKLKTLHDFIRVVENVTIEEVIDYFMSLELLYGECNFYRVVSMDKKKRRTFNVCVHSVYIVSNNVSKLNKKKINVVEFNVFDNHEYS